MNKLIIDPREILLNEEKNQSRGQSIIMYSYFCNIFKCFIFFILAAEINQVMEDITQSQVAIKKWGLMNFHFFDHDNWIGFTKAQWIFSFSERKNFQLQKKRLQIQFVFVFLFLVVVFVVVVYCLFTGWFIRNHSEKNLFWWNRKKFLVHGFSWFYLMTNCFRCCCRCLGCAVCFLLDSIHYCCCFSLSINNWTAKYLHNQFSFFFPSDYHRAFHFDMHFFLFSKLEIGEVFKQRKNFPIIFHMCVCIELLHIWNLTRKSKGIYFWNLCNFFVHFSLSKFLSFIDSELFSFCDRKCQIATNKEKGANNVMYVNSKRINQNTQTISFFKGGSFRWFMNWLVSNI